MPDRITIDVVQGTYPTLRRVLTTLRDESNPGALQDITGYAFRLIVKRDLEDADADAWFSVDGEVAEASSGEYEFALTHTHTLRPDGTWPGELRWWSPPAAPTTEHGDDLAGAGAGNVTNGFHWYRYTYVSPRGESDGSPVSAGVSVVNNATDGKVNLTGIAVGPAGTTARKIYRTVADDEIDGEYKLVATISDNVTTTYQDNTADGSLGATLAAAADTDYPPEDAQPVDYTVTPRVSA